MRTNKLVLIGEVAGTRGNKGEIKVILHTDFPERFSQLASIRFYAPGEKTPLYAHELENQWFHKGVLILKLKGVDSIAEAERLKDLQIKISTAELVALPADSFYIFDLIGLECVTTDGRKLGKVVEVIQTGANDVYVLKPCPGITDSKEILLPALKSVIREVSPAAGKIVVDLPPGLVE
ncbi:MAG TPA: 16S rRNA processing protein RimM [Firmicutes bacterium]|nr:16S rRNA processing protein RimM [Bacillota bacterium]